MSLVGPEQAVRAMEELTKALQANTVMSRAVARELHIFNEIMLGVSRKQGGAAMVKMLLESAGRMFARSG